MEYSIFRSDERGRFENDWLQTRFSFSFSNWYNPNRMGFSALRVFNDDKIAPKSGFEPHSHQNMEIVTIMKSGVLTHGDDFGNTQTTLGAQEVQVMSAGRGVTHSEKNLGDDVVELFQIWFLPKQLNIKPEYSQKAFDWDRELDKWTKLVSPKNLPLKDTLQINQDIFISIGSFEKDTEFVSSMHSTALYLHIMEGEVGFGEELLQAGDALQINSIGSIELSIKDKCKILAIELPSLH